MVYLRKAAKKDSTQIFQQPHKDYNIAVNDVLYVRILTGNPEISALYNNVPASGFSISMSSEADQYINGFTVDKEGKIRLPVLGTVSVEGLTLFDAEKRIQQLADQYLIDATVIVRLLNYKVTVLGEVAQPGVYSHYNDQMTILQAIGKAGDITDLGDKRNVMVIRSVPEGQVTYQVDLTKKELLTSPAFFVKPNDVIYVKPSGSKAFRINLPIMSIFLSSLTTVIVLLQYFENQ
ncbi:polysaccharide biosynthesis/export family protein [Thermophagus xiamenensis]|uniref:Protein involved in gliding motility EpsA n=2 Tax=Thermophagus xiamenensis TaxID=385682 RepID=A0A1I2C707_9BACT|nr:polysaccharide biosynthesis/export family protein [Thermophagus xiamenensis]SFE63440.1 protein involved in gliding motility EpsA [Thermophagus xiamenensis]